MLEHVYGIVIFPRNRSTTQLIFSRCIGGRHTQTSRFPTREEYLKVTIDYTLAAARAFADMMASAVDSETGDKFRFVFCSGDSSEIDQKKTLFIMGPTRKAKVQYLSVSFCYPHIEFC